MRLSALLPCSHIRHSLTDALTMYLTVIADDDGPQTLSDSNLSGKMRQLQTNCLLALAACDKTFYRYIHVLLLISVSLPLSTAMPERTFSAMKTLKIYLHSRLTNSISAVYQCVIACYSLGFQ